ncbi:helix-turn-helix domain-containing protein, partial [Klebsiella pneumoniae]|uniref:helix-turn-helix domain-containing protein n=1 Tax=Klebsiella pneumoniae TaxID=573 RepID=UPI003B592E7F
WENKELRQTEKYLLLYLLDRADERGVCWPSIATIARHTGMSRRGVIYVLGRLRAMGYLTWEQVGASNTYRINLERLVQGVHQGGAID